jgi:hypothetical protein
MLKLDGTDIAPEGYVFVCRACGKTSRSRYGFDVAGRSACSYGWDESCMLNCALYKIANITFKGKTAIGIDGEPEPTEGV